MLVESKTNYTTPSIHNLQDNYKNNTVTYEHNSSSWFGYPTFQITNTLKEHKSWVVAIILNKVISTNSITYFKFLNVLNILSKLNIRPIYKNRLITT